MHVKESTTQRGAACNSHPSHRAGRRLFAARCPAAPAARWLAVPVCTQCCGIHA